MTEVTLTLEYDFFDYPGSCCGVGELGNFHYGMPRRYSDKRSRIPLGEPSVIDQEIRERVIGVLIEDLDEDGTLYDQYLLNAYVISETPEEWRNYFKESSVWEETKQWTNVKTGNQITAYSWLMSFDGER